MSRFPSFCEMGSLEEEEELVKMVQDFIESESTPPTISSTSSNCHALNHRTQYFILQDILRSETAAEAKVLKGVLKHMKGRHGAEKTTSLNRWLVTRLKMDGFNASLCQTSWSTPLGCPAGEYEFVEVITTEDENYANPVRLIVDTDFRSQFELARPTQYYRELIESLPVIFVGTENKLCKIISLLCSAAKQSLRERGLHVPPWRTTTYMQSKWLSGRAGNNGNGRRESYVGATGDAPAGTVGKWVPPTVRPKRRDLGGGSGLSSQFSNMSINCCYV